MRTPRPCHLALDRLVHGERAPRAALILCALIALPSFAAAQGLGNGLRVQALAALPEDGAVRVTVEVLDGSTDQSLGDTLSPADFVVQLAEGVATTTDARRAQDLRLRRHTVLAIDHSLSFRQYGFDEAGWSLAEHLASGLDERSSLSLLLFGYQKTEYPSRRSSTDFQQDLRRARTVKWDKITRLYAYLTEAIDLAALENPGGQKRVVVFTDGDEESRTYSWRQVADRAIERGVELDVVLFRPPAGRVDPSMLDNLRAMAEQTGGQPFEYSDLAATEAALDRWRERRQRYLSLTVQLRCLSRGSEGNTLRVDYAPAGSRLLWSQDQSFRASPSAVIYEPCASRVAPIGLAVTQPVAGEPDREGALSLLWVLLGGLLLLLASASFFLMGRRSEPRWDAQPPPQGAGWTPSVDSAAETLPRPSAPSAPVGLTPGAGLDDDPIQEEAAGDEDPPSDGHDGPAKPEGDIEAPITAPAPGQAESPEDEAPRLTLSAAQSQEAPQQRPKPPILRPAPISLIELSSDRATAPSRATVDSPTVAELPDLPETFLVVLGGPYMGRRYRIYKERFQVGGANIPGNDLVVDVQTVSGQHAIFEIGPDGEMWVTDLASRNGTAVNGRRIRKGGKAKIRAGDQVMIGPDLLLLLEQKVRPRRSLPASSRGGDKTLALGGQASASTTREGGGGGEAGATGRKPIVLK